MTKPKQPASVTIKLSPKRRVRPRGQVTLYLDKELFGKFKKRVEDTLNRSPSEAFEEFMRKYLGDKK